MIGWAGFTIHELASCYVLIYRRFELYIGFFGFLGRLTKYTIPSNP